MRPRRLTVRVRLARRIVALAMALLSVLPGIASALAHCATMESGAPGVAASHAGASHATRSHATRSPDAPAPRHHDDARCDAACPPVSCNASHCASPAAPGDVSGDAHVDASRAFGAASARAPRTGLATPEPPPPRS